MDELIQISNQVDDLQNIKNKEQYCQKKDELKIIINLELSDIQNDINKIHQNEIYKLEESLRKFKILKKQLNNQLITLNNSYMEEVDAYKFPLELNEKYKKLKKIDEQHTENKKKIEEKRKELTDIFNTKNDLNKELSYNTNIIQDGYKKEMNKLEIKAVKDKKEQITKQLDSELKENEEALKKAKIDIKNLNAVYDRKLKENMNDKNIKIKNLRSKINKNNKKKTKTELEKRINLRENTILEVNIEHLEKEYKERDTEMNSLYDEELDELELVLSQFEKNKESIKKEFNFTIKMLDLKLIELEQYFLKLFERNQDILAEIFNLNKKQTLLEAEILGLKNKSEYEIEKIKEKIIYIEIDCAKNYESYRNKYSLQNDELKAKIMAVESRIETHNKRIEKINNGEADNGLNQQKKYIIDLLKKLN